MLDTTVWLASVDDPPGLDEVWLSAVSELPELETDCADELAPGWLVD